MSASADASAASGNLGFFLIVNMETHRGKETSLGRPEALAD
jgi:hypothetical protein